MLLNLFHQNYKKKNNQQNPTKTVQQAFTSEWLNGLGMPDNTLMQGLIPLSSPALI